MRTSGETNFRYLSAQFLLDNLDLPAHQDAQVLQPHSFVLLMNSLEVQVVLVDPGDQTPLNAPEDLAEKSLVNPVLPLVLALLGSQVVPADHCHQKLGVQVFLGVLLDLEKTG